MKRGTSTEYHYSLVIHYHYRRENDKRIVVESFINSLTIAEHKLKPTENCEVSIQ